MECKISTIEKLSKCAPEKYVKSFLSKTKYHVVTGASVNLKDLKVGQQKKVIGIDSDKYGSMYLNVYQRTQ